MLSVTLHKPCQACPRGPNWPLKEDNLLHRLEIKNLSETMRLTTQVSGIGSLSLLYFGQIMSIRYIWICVVCGR